MDCFFALIHTHLTEGSQSIWRRLEDRHSSAACQREDVRMAGCMNEWMEGAHDVRGPPPAHTDAVVPLRVTASTLALCVAVSACPRVRACECVPANALTVSMWPQIVACTTSPLHLSPVPLPCKARLWCQNVRRSIAGEPTPPVLSSSLPAPDRRKNGSSSSSSAHPSRAGALALLALLALLAFLALVAFLAGCCSAVFLRADGQRGRPPDLLPS